MQQIEAIASYWNRRPCNIRHSKAPVGSERWSLEVTERKYFVEPHIPGFAQFERWRGKDVLEIGCGIGTDTLEFIKAGAAVYAVDLSGESVALARKRCPKASFWIADAEAWLPDGPFDLVYSFGVLHHMPNPKAVLNRIRLSENGELRIMLYSKWCLKNVLGNQPEAQSGCPLARRYTVRDAKQLLESCGFGIQSIMKAHIFPYRVADYIEHRYVKRWYYRMPQRLFSWLERHFGEHLLIVARQA